MPGGMSGKPSVVVRRVPDKGMYDNLYIVNCNIDYANISGLLRLAGTNAAITIGATPPTSSTAGTGLWIDRTGLYALNTNVLQTKIDAATGAITAAAGATKLDVNGISIISLDDYSDTRALRLIESTGGALFGTLAGMYAPDSNVHRVLLSCKSIAAHDSVVKSMASAPAGYIAQVQSEAVSGAALVGLYVQSDSDGISGVFIDGGLNVGGTAAPGDNNLLVDADARIGGGLYVGATNVDPVAGTIQLAEVSAPSAPAANNVIIYAVDNGSGKTQLMALFSSGAAQQLAIQP